MKIIQGEIPGLLILEPAVYRDERGLFMETYNQEALASQGFGHRFVQDNESLSLKGVIRALHFQNPPRAQGKLVRVVRGSVWDIAVDIRRGSPWYGRYSKVFLSEENKKMFWLPPGFAHGFVALEEHTLFSYKCTDVYSREHESSIRWDDPDLAIDWGIDNPLVSDRDRNALFFRDHQGLFEYREA